MIYTIFILSCAVGLLFFDDMDLRIRIVFGSKTVKARMDHFTYDVPRRFFALVRTFLGFRLDFENASGRKLPERFMIVANHQSLLDIPIMFYFFKGHPIRFVSKKELGRGVPLVSQILRYQGHCLVDRKAHPVRAMRAIDAFARRVDEMNWCPVIFPEGTRSKDGVVRQFHSAGVRRVLEIAPSPLVSVALDGGWRIGDLKKVFTNIRGGRYRIKILRVYDTPKDKREINSVLVNAQDEIAKEIERWNSQDTQSGSHPGSKG